MAVVVLTTAISVGVSQWFPFVSMAENWLADYRVATLSPSQSQSADVVIVTITEDTVAQFPYRSPLDRRFVAQLLTRIDQAGARAIGVDVLFDGPTEPDTHPRPSGADADPLCAQ